jgi:general secretion pathway protein D
MSDVCDARRRTPGSVIASMRIRRIMKKTTGHPPILPSPTGLIVCLSLLACLFCATLVTSKAFAEPKADLRKTDKVTFNFVDVELPTVTKFISEITGKNFIFDERVRGKITIIAPTKLNIDDAFNLFTSVLELKGFTIVPSGVDAYKIIPVAEAKQRGLSIGLVRGPVNESYIAQLIPLRHVSSDDVLRFVQPVVSKDGYISTFGPGNLLLVIDSGLNVEKVLSLVNAIDQPSGKEVPETVLLRHASADSVAKIINEGFGRARTRSTGGQQIVTDDARAVADSRLNALILFGDRGPREAMKSLISLLDVPSPETTGRINVYFLENADATELAKVLEGIIRGSPPASRQATPQAAPPVVPFEAAGGITVTPDKSTNALIVVASPADYQNLLQVIRQLDKRKRQVYVEAMIVEATIDRLRELGVQWRVVAKKDNTPVFVGGFGQVDSSTISSIITGLQGVSTGGIGNLFSFPITTTGPDGNPVTTTLSIPQYAALFSLNEFNDSVNVLSTPQILTSDNKEAEILVGENVPFISQQQTGVTTGTAILNSIVRQDIGIILRITPQITEGDHIRLDIYQEISSLKDQRDILTINLGPSITKRSTKTSVVVKDNQTVVIGGLMQENVQDTVIKVPLLGDIPVLGWLFKTTKTTRTKTNLLVFLNPHIIKESERLQQITERKHKEFQASESRYAPGELMVKFKDGVSPDVAAAVISSKGASVVTVNEQFKVYRIRLREGQPVPEAQQEFGLLPEVEFAEPNYLIRIMKNE